MKKILKLISMLSALCLLVSVFSLGVFAVENSGTYGEGVEWSLSANGTLTIWGTGAMADSDNSTEAPWGMSVKNVVIQDGIKSIGKFAFSNHTKLLSVTIPESVTVVDNGAFYKCSSLKNVTLPSSLEVLGEFAFTLCTSLEKVNIPDGVNEIKNYSFAQCTALRSIKIPDSVTAIRQAAFFKSSSLDTVSFGADLEIIEKSAFWGCAFERLSFGDKLGSIGEYAFTECYSLYDVKFPNSLKEISDSAFYDCWRLKTVLVPESVETIGYYALGFNHVNAQGIRPVENFCMEVVKGSVAHTYAIENRFPVTFVESQPVFPSADRQEYIDIENKTMPNVVENTNATALISSLAEYGITAVIFDKDANVLSDNDAVGTGCNVKTSDGSEYTVIVCGDVDGTGKVDSTDYLKIKSMFLGEGKLYDVYFKAADADGNEEINSTDYLKIKSYFYGETNLYA